MYTMYSYTVLCLTHYCASPSGPPSSSPAAESAVQSCRETSKGIVITIQQPASSFMLCCGMVLSLNFIPQLNYTVQKMQCTVRVKYIPFSNYAHRTKTCAMLYVIHTRCNNYCAIQLKKTVAVLTEMLLLSEMPEVSI